MKLNTKTNKFHDKHGYPIYDGDVLKVFHFIGSRNKKHYMYKVASSKGEHMYAISITGLIRTPSAPHRCRLEVLGEESEVEIVAGSGPGDFYSFEQRDRIRD